MASLSPKELLKYDWRVEVFLRKYKSKDKKERTFDLVNNKKVSFIYDADVAKVVSRKNQVQLRTIRLLGEDGNEYKLSDLEKSAEFGGKGAGSGTLKEDIELQSLIKQLNDIRKKQKTGTVPIKVGGKTFNVADAITTPGTPKSDFHLVDDNGKEVVWISHKDGRTAKDFQQWGGISKRSEPTIFSHPETQSFIDDLKKTYPDGLPRRTTLYRKIKDDKLKNFSVYGNQYGNDEGRQNVSILIQGPIKLQKSGNVYKFVSNHVHYNGEKMTGDFEPVLTAIYKGDRSDAGVKGTRIVIMPIAGRKMTGEI
jgi:hypothetical protein